MRPGVPFVQADPSGASQSTQSEDDDELDGMEIDSDEEDSNGEDEEQPKCRRRRASGNTISITSDDDDESEDAEQVDEKLTVHITLSTDIQKGAKSKKTDLVATMGKVDIAGLTRRKLVTWTVNEINNTSSKANYLLMEYIAQIDFTVPRKVTKPTRLNDASFEVMLENAQTMGKPETKLFLHGSAEDLVARVDDDDEQPPKKKAKTKPPNKGDLNPANKPVAEKIGKLQLRYKCMARDGSEWCFVDPETGKHVRLTWEHLDTWAVAWEGGNCDEMTPPNHPLFDVSKPANISVLQQRIRDQARNNAAPAAPATTINATIVMPDPKGATASGSDERLLPSNTKLGPKLSVDDFCATYDLGEELAGKLKSAGFRSTLSFGMVTLAALEKILNVGDVAELRAAVSGWALAS
ncbi:hypothetical protein MKEN_00002200 [Mycena kentingensis (nom. inval.)]|nr:hypothetical protein MKEN_00002200 [Mycena kentingensis (nom. inval.)]